MFEEVKSPSPNGKKLFEWDDEQRRLSMIIKKKSYLCELGVDNKFVCIFETDKPPPDN